MATYKVLVIAMTIKNNKIAKSKDLIDESQLNSSAEELVKAGFIEKVETEVETEVETKTETEIEVEVETEVETEVEPIVKKVVKKVVKK